MSKRPQHFDQLMGLGIPKVVLDSIVEEYRLHLDQSDVNIENIAKDLTEEQAEDVYWRYRFAGQVSTNLFYLVNLGSQDIQSIAKKLKQEAAHISQAIEKEMLSEEAADWYYEPGSLRISESKVTVDKALMGFNYVGNPVWVFHEGKPQYLPRLHKASIILRKKSNILEVRSSSYGVGKGVFRWFIDNTKLLGSPLCFDKNMEEQFRRKVKKYTSATVDIPEGYYDDYIGRERLYARTNEGKRKDIRLSLRFQELVKNGRLSIAYATLDLMKDMEVSFNLNARLGRLFFKAYVREEVLDAVINIVEKVYESVGGYPQKSLYENLRIPRQEV
ncbi:MAG: hypothetical protein HYY22_02010 [Thaumarchaeota archaeon]|nr:hypothetical protein [Nitrososphaerota archaeon]